VQAPCPDKDSTLRREYEAAALRDFDPADDRLGSILLKKALLISTNLESVVRG
jgi:hypothetical protein